MANRQIRELVIVIVIILIIGISIVIIVVVAAADADAILTSLLFIRQPRFGLAHEKLLLDNVLLRHLLSSNLQRENSC